MLGLSEPMARLRAGKRYGGWGAIAFAAANGHTDCMCQILKADPDAEFSSADDFSTSLLELTRSRGHVGAVAVLETAAAARAEIEMDNRLAAERALW